MTSPAALRFTEFDIDAAADWTGRIAVLVDEEGGIEPLGRRINSRARRAISRAIESAAFEKLGNGEVLEIGWPTGLSARGLLVLKLPKRPSGPDARRAGAALAARRGSDPLLLIAGNHRAAGELAFGMVLRSYSFETHKTGDSTPPAEITVMAGKPEELAKTASHQAAIAEGVFFTRDLVNEPANILTTEDFAARLAAMQELGLEVTILEEEDLAKLGMRLLLSVGHGSASPSKVVVMEWKGGGEAAPLALVGKGVVFDTGGISLKPAQGMEEMTMDMGGAGVVSGVMRTLALRRAKASVVGLVGLVENMPSDRATRPGDVVKSMKGDTVEIINTDAEGRLVLADVLWYAQETYKPAGIVDLATLTGAMIIALGNEKAGVFSNDDGLADAFLKAAAAEGEGAWRMPLAPAYDKLLKSRVADMKNVGGRAAGSITAAQFLQRFVQEGTPWVHLDIAGVASSSKATALAPEGASGWGVMALNRLVADDYER